MKNKAKILLVEDDQNLRIVLQDYLKMIGYDITVCEDGYQGLEEFKNNEFDLCILDIMMPRKDGFTLATEIRNMNEIIPIIFLTAKSLKEDRIKGFKIGCDDYITKPFSTEELSLRLKAILKRCQNIDSDSSDKQDKIFNIGNYTFNVNSMTLSIGKNERLLTRKESALLSLLSEHKEKIVTREYALKKIWGDDDYFIGRSMDVFITKLRKYLAEDPRISITNIHGTGFRLDINK
ncbi:response regulator transcription factor [Bacteroidota bacterium]